MRTQPRLLRFFAHQAREHRLVTFRDVAGELGITEQAAVSTLERLWRHQLITPTTPRPRGFKWRPAPEERVRELAFRLTQKGRARITWWDEERRREGGSPWPF